MEPIKIVLRIAAVAVFLAAILFFVRFCTNLISDHEEGLMGDGNIIRRNISIEKPFHSVSVNGSMNVWIRQGKAPAIQVLADSNLQPHIRFDFEDDRLIIRQKGSLHWTGNTRVLITVPDLQGVEVKGAAEIRIPDTLQTESFKLNIEGAAMADLVLKCRNMTSHISGAGEIQLKGMAEEAETQINGAGKFSAGDCMIKNLDISINGAGYAMTWVTDTLKASVNGAGEIKYRGNPHLIPIISGVGRIRAAE
jgi:hypothetical protein